MNFLTETCPKEILHHSPVIYKTGLNILQLYHLEVSPSIDKVSYSHSQRRASLYEERQVYFQGTKIWNIDIVTLIEFLPWEVITKMLLQY